MGGIGRAVLGSGGAAIHVTHTLLACSWSCRTQCVTGMQRNGVHRQQWAKVTECECYRCCTS